MYINLQSKGDNGDSRHLPNVTASRGRCKPGASSRFSNITPEPRYQKCRAHTGRVRSDAGPALRDTICGAIQEKLQVCCNRWLKRENSRLSSFYRTKAFLSVVLRFDSKPRPERERARHRHMDAQGAITERKIICIKKYLRI